LQGWIKNIHSITVHNSDTATATVTVKIDDNGTEKILVKQAISVGESLVYETDSGWQVLSPITPPFTDTTAIVKGSTDATKLVRIEADGLTTATTRVATMPDANIKLSGHATGFTADRIPYTAGTTGGVLTDSANLTYDGGTLTNSAGALVQKGTLTANQTSAGVFDFAAGVTRILSYGADGATKGAFSVILSASDGSPQSTPFQISTADLVTLSGGLVWGTGTTTYGMVVKRKTADESVTSSTTLQDDDHLTFAVGANEEWEGLIRIAAADDLNTTGLKVAINTPAGATMRADMVAFGGATTNYSLSTTIGAAISASAAGIGSQSGFVLVHFWVLNGATPGNITLQWAQNTSDAAALIFRKGSSLVAHRVA
jgi:hypothetical protein